MLAIEIIEGCNFKCYFCQAKDVKTNAYMDLELFKRLILEAKDLGIDIIDMIPAKGEPFLHPDIYEMLDFANKHMKEVLIFSNGTAINVKRLKQIDMTHISLNISLYGKTVERFKELTCVSEKQFEIFNRRLDEMRAAGIKFEIGRRDYGWKLRDWNTLNDYDFDPNVKCQYHSVPKVHPDGRVSFCKFVRCDLPTSETVMFNNVTNKSLKEVLEDPIRFKFMDDQSICVKHCGSYDCSCRVKQTLSSVKLLLSSKKNYQANKERVDLQYKEIEDEVHEIVQRAQQQVRN